jgi:soluble lytic murein transglycosylase
MSRASSRSSSGGVVRLRRVFLLVAALLVIGVVIGVARFDFGGTIGELTLPLRHEDIIRQQAKEKGVPADLIAAVIYEESKFQDQTSSAGARGLMQITPDTADTIENLSGGETFVYEDLADPDLNIRYGTFYLAYLLDKYDGDVVAALAAYNAGEGNADAWGGAGMAIADIEFPETYDYVKDVIERRDQYRKKYAEELGL